jgi:hypothetical protein
VLGEGIGVTEVLVSAKELETTRAVCCAQLLEQETAEQP